MKPQRAAFGWILWMLSLSGFLYCAIVFAVSDSAVRGSYRSLEIIVFLLAGSAASSSASFFSTRLPAYRVALVGRIVSLLLLMIWAPERPQIEFILLGFAALEISFYEPYPANLHIGFIVLALAGGVTFAVSQLRLSIPLLEALFSLVTVPAVAVLVLLPASLFTRYREDIILVMRDNARLDKMVLELAKANLQYQDFATSAAEAGMKEERLRITRDIHDVVGYTLTNNIAMMEAATDMMRRNPLGVPALIASARDNAKEGLQQIRLSLYKLRAQSAEGPQGLRALTRLCRLFERATRIEVRLSFGNARWEYGDTIDSALYHLVQEALMNAFRHGKAMHGTVALWETDHRLTISISDDGMGATSIHEGIGLPGMRERIEALGGRLHVTSLPHGFSVRAELPLGKGQ